MSFEPTIGLEIHAQLLTHTKIFCGCRTTFGDPPNTHVCPVCLGLPGALPVLNGRAVDAAASAALALGCAVHARSVFARKNYFYPDLPKGYQISQYDQPLATGGVLDVTPGAAPGRVRITRVHLEEDAGKSLHEGSGDWTGVDFNRAGVPLIEIVTEPDLHSAVSAAAFYERLRDLLVWLGVNDGNMEEGSLRCDANVSVRPAGAPALGVKVEIKNLNSFRYLQKALEFEIDRQARLLERGERVVQETRLWDQATNRTVSMRSKEEAHDYRYFPDPDLPVVEVSEARLAAIRENLPELPSERRARFAVQYGLPAYDATELTRSRGLADYFEHVAAAVDPKLASNWVMGEVARKLKETGGDIRAFPIDAHALADLVALVVSGVVNQPTAKLVFERMCQTGEPPRAIVEREGLAQVSDEAALVALVRRVVESERDAVAQYRAGRQQVFGFLVGQVMKAARGKANPGAVNALLKREIERE